MRSIKSKLLWILMLILTCTLGCDEASKAPAHSELAAQPTKPGLDVAIDAGGPKWEPKADARDVRNTHLQAHILLRNDRFDLLKKLPISMFDQVFSVSDPTLTAHFDAWVNADLNALPAYLARGNHYQARAFEARGGGFSQQTSDSRLDRAMPLWEKALDDSLSAIALSPSSAEALRLHLSICRFAKFSRCSREQNARAERDFGHSLELWLTRVTDAMPRWNGSMQQLKRLEQMAQQSPLSEYDKRIVSTDIACALLVDFSRASLPNQLKEFNEIIGEGPASSRCLIERNGVRANLDRSNENFKDLIYLLAKNPNDYYNAKRLADLYDLRSKRQHWLSYYQKVAPGEARFDSRIGEEYFYGGDWASALPHLKTAFAKAPEDSRARFNLAQLYQLEPKLKSERMKLLSSLATDFGFDGLYFVARKSESQAASIHLARGDFGLVEELTRECVTRISVCSNYRAEALLGLGNMADAKSMIERLVQQRPKHRPSRAIQARLLALQGDHEKALLAWQRVHSFAPRDPILVNEFARYASEQNLCIAGEIARELLTVCNEEKLCASVWAWARQQKPKANCKA